MRKPQDIRIGAAAIIFNGQEEILLQKRSDNGFWGLPGGAVDVGETVERAVVREVEEETGLVVTVSRLIGIYSDPQLYSITSYPGGDVIHHVTALFECRPDSGELCISSESTDIGYFPFMSLPERTLLSVPPRLKDALMNRDRAYVR